MFKAQLITDCGHTWSYHPIWNGGSCGIGPCKWPSPPVWVATGAQQCQWWRSLPQHKQSRPSYVPPPGKKSNLLNKIPCLWMMSERFGTYGPTGTDILTSWLAGRSYCRSWMKLDKVGWSWMKLGVVPSSSIISQPSVCSWNCAESACFSGCFIPWSCPTLDSKSTCAGSYRMLNRRFPTPKTSTLMGFPPIDHPVWKPPINGKMCFCGANNHTILNRWRWQLTAKEGCSYAAHHGHLPRTGHHRVQSNPGLRAEKRRRDMPQTNKNKQLNAVKLFGSKFQTTNVTMASTRGLSNASHAHSETSLDAFGFHQFLYVFCSP